ncbi:MAG: hypothetical protein WCS03_14965 [Bacteroidota bacterium]
MPNQNIISRISKVDFFAVLPAGFYLCITLFLTFQKIVDNDISLKFVWETLIDFASKPVAFVFTLYVAYILGSTIQVNSVYFTEYLTPPRLFQKDTFPYPNELEKAIKRLNKLSKATKHDINKTPDIEGLPESDIIHAFNYWKDTLSMECPEAFDYYQTHEAQTRFYSGIFISSLIGLICSIIILIRASMTFYYPGVILLSVSLVLLFTIGGQFRRVRRKETLVLLYQYIVYLQQKSGKI